MRQKVGSQERYKYLDVSYLRKRLVPQYFGRIELHDVLTSTNDHARELGKKVDQPTLIIANQQTKGRGRNGKTFFSPKQNIYCSLLLFHNFDTRQLTSLTIIMCLAASEALEAMVDVRIPIKWVNDLYLNRKKIGGILIENQKKAAAKQFVMIGIGLNLYEAILPVELKKIVTNVEAETSDVVNKTLLLEDMIKRFFRYYAMIQVENYDFLQKYRQKNLLIGKEVWFSANKTKRYKVLGITNEGHLLVRDGKNTEVFSAGEVSLCWD